MREWSGAVDPDGVLPGPKCCDGFEEPFLRIGVPASGHMSQCGGLEDGSVDQQSAGAAACCGHPEFDPVGACLFDGHVVLGDVGQCAGVEDDSDPLPVPGRVFGRVAAVVGFGFANLYAVCGVGCGCAADWG